MSLQAKKRTIATICIAMSIVGVFGVLMGASVGPWPVTGNLPVNPGGYGSMSVLSITPTSSNAAATVNLSQSAGTVTVGAGAGTVLTVVATGTYTLGTGTATIVNGLPAYAMGTGTNAVNLWNYPTAGGYIITTTASFAGTPSSYLIASGGTTLQGSSFTTGAGTYTSNGSGTASVGTTLLPSGVSQPCSGLIVSCTSSGSLISSTTAAGVFPIPANVPITLPVNNLNEVYVTGNSANTIGYATFK